jgi:hypothetical protein
VLGRHIVKAIGITRKVQTAAAYFPIDNAFSQAVAAAASFAYELDFLKVLVDITQGVSDLHVLDLTSNSISLKSIFLRLDDQKFTDVHHIKNPGRIRHLMFSSRDLVNDSF